MLIAGNQFYRAAGRFSLTDLSEIERYAIPTNISNIAHTRLGVIGISRILYIQPYGTTAQDDLVEHDLPTEFAYRNIAHQDDLLYMVDRGFTTNNFGLAEISEEDGATYVSQLNINHPSGGMRDIAIYRDTLYLLGVNNGNVYTLDIRKYRPVAKRTKTTIYPVFANEGDTIDLTQYSPDAERFTFDVGFDKPPYLSINASNELVVGSGAETVFVKLKAINRIDATETESFGFYLIIRQATAPIWRDVSELTMRANSSYDLFQLVDADSIAFRSGRPRPTGSSLANGVFTVGTVGGISHFTARKGSRSSHIEINIDVVQGIGSDSSEVSGYRIEIAGIDVTSDSVGFPSVSETLDPVVINEYRVNEASIVLRNEGGKYNSDLAGNFWETNGLNAGGFQNAVKIYLEHLDGSESLHFSGVVNESFVPIKDATFKLNSSDISSRLRKALVQAFGTLEKWDSLRKQSDEDSYEGVYVPEPGLGPMQVGTGKARSDRTDLTISRLELPSEGPAAENTAYMTPTEFRTAGGFLTENPLLRFKGEHRSEDVRFLIHQLAINKEVYNTEIDIPGVTVDTPFLLNRGSVAFSVGSPTRTTRLPVDWVHDSTNSRVLILLSNPERHVADLLVQYDVQTDSYRVLHTFDKDTAVHRIERRNATNYYILTSGKITQDRSARELPRQTDATGYAYDSASVGSEIKIYHYNSSSGTLTALVAEDDSYPPQLGIHYWVGFENPLYTDEFEGIVPSYRGPFKWHSNNLYYRYAKDGEFGVARVNTGGTTTQMIGQAVGGYQDHLNFAFDINSSGSIYFVYSDAYNHTIYESNTLPPSTLTNFDNDLSSVDIAVQIKIEIKIVTVSNGDVITVTGTNLSGATITEDIDISEYAGSGVSFTVLTSQRYARITELDTTDLFRFTSTRYILSVSGTALIIKHRASGGTETTLLTDSKELSELTDLDDTGGVYLGCHECVFHNNHLYLLVPIGRVDEDSGEYSLSREKAAGMVLFRCDVTAGSPSLTAIDTWDYVQLAGCGLVVHNGSIHYIEHPQAATAFKPVNPDL